MNVLCNDFDAAGGGMAGVWPDQTLTPVNKKLFFRPK